MIVTGLDNDAIGGLTVSLSNGEAKCTIVCTSDKAQHLMGRTFTVQLPDGETFVGVIHAVDGVGNQSEQVTLTATSIVNLTLREPFRASSSIHALQFDPAQYTTCQNAYTGVIFGSIDAATGEPAREDALHYAARVVRTMAPSAMERFGYGVECRIEGGMSGKQIGYMQWSGQTAEELLSWLVGDLFNVAINISGNALVLKRFDYDSPKTYIQSEEASEVSVGYDLEQTTSNVVVEGPNITTQKKNSLVLSKSNRYIGLSTLYNDAAGSAFLEGDDLASSDAPENTGYDEVLSVFRYQSDNNKTVNLIIPVDRREAYSTGHAGEALRLHGWKKTQAVIDEDLGLAKDASGAELLTRTWNRRNEMATIAEMYADSLRRLAITGKLSVDARRQIGVGDVIQLWCVPSTAVVMAVDYNLQSDTKILTLGTTTGSYDGYKARVKLSKVVAKQKDKGRESDEPTVLVEEYGRVFRWTLAHLRWRREQDKALGWNANYRVLSNMQRPGKQKIDTQGRKARQDARREHSIQVRKGATTNEAANIVREKFNQPTKRRR